MDRSLFTGAAALAIVLASNGSANAEVQQSGPPEIMARIADLDKHCRAAGGTPVPRPYVLVHDYTGDGRPDYLISEGNYNCSGQPALFRPGGVSGIEVYMTRPNGHAVSIYLGTVAGYRLLERTPTLIEIVKADPAACAGKPACGLDLVWNPATSRLEEKPVGGAAPVTSSPPGTIVPGTLTPLTRAQFIAACKDGAQSCAYEYTVANKTLPLAREMLALQRLSPDQRSYAGIKAALPTLRGWLVNKPTVAGQVATVQAQTFPDVSLLLPGTGAVASVSWAWNDHDTFPYDMPGALRLAGAKVTEYACASGGDTNFGDERTLQYRVEAPGLAPFAVSMGGRNGAMGGQMAYWSIDMALGAPVPGLAALRAQSRKDDVEAKAENPTVWSTDCND